MVDVTLMALQNPNACLSDIDPELKDKYHIVLVNGKSTKLAKNCENFATGKNQQQLQAYIGTNYLKRSQFESKRPIIDIELRE